MRQDLEKCRRELTTSTNDIRKLKVELERLKNDHAKVVASKKV